MKLLPRFLRARTPEQVLSPHETAEQIRKTTLNLLLYGATSSGDSIPTSHLEREANLASLLQYSPRTQTHARKLANALNAPTNFSIVSRVGSVPDEASPEGNVLYTQEGLVNPTHIYSFVHPETPAHLNTAYMLEELRKKQKPYTAIKIIGKPSSWATFYSHTPRIANETPDSYLKKQEKSFGIFTYFSRRFLLGFVFTPIGLSAKDFAKKFGCSIREQAAVTKLRQETHQGFESITLQLDSKRLSTLQTDPFVLRESGTLGDQIATVVNIGTVEIGNLRYGVWTGSELPLATEKSPSRTLATRLRPSTAGSRS